MPLHVPPRQLGIPVRVTRKQKDSTGTYGTAYIYDGLYDVVSYRYAKGIEGYGVYQYLLRRRPGQGALLSQVGPRAELR